MAGKTAQRLLWFISLWVAGVTVLGIIAMLIKAVIL